MTTTLSPAREPAAVAPGPRGLPLVGSMFDFGDGILRTLVQARASYGDVVRFRLPGQELYLLSHPDHIRHVLQDQARSYPKSQFYDTLKPLLGEGLLTSRGDLWLRQRRLAQPAFHRQRIAGFAETMVRRTEQMLARWEQSAPGERIDVAEEMMRLTLEIVGETLFSTDLSMQAGLVGPALTTALRAIDARTHPFALPEWIPTPANRRLRAAARTIENVVVAIIADRRSGPPGDDLLGMLMAARDEASGEGMSDRQLRDEVMTIMMAGHETTANALAWTWYLLSLHPAVERRLQAELRTVLGGRAPTVADLPELRYTAMVVDEAMRLYPPAWMIDRVAAADDQIGGYRIPRGAVMLLSPYVTHRHPEFWSNPEGFDPERFSSERASQRPRLAYFPFGAGQRQCIGTSFALMEAQLVLATIAQRFRLDLVPDHTVAPEPLTTLRPRHGVLMTVHRQSPAEVARDDR